MAGPLRLTIIALVLTFGSIGILVFQLWKSMNRTESIYQVEIPFLQNISTVLRLEQVLERQVEQIVHFKDPGQIDDLLGTKDSLEFALNELLVSLSLRQLEFEKHLE